MTSMSDFLPGSTIFREAIVEDCSARVTRSGAFWMVELFFTMAMAGGATSGQLLREPRLSALFACFLALDSHEQ